MKNKINNRLLIATTIATISMTGCVSKSIEVIDTKANSKIAPQIKKVKVSNLKSLSSSKKDDCVDCYVDISKAPRDVDSVNNVKLEEYKNPYLVDESYREHDYKDESLYSKIEDSSSIEENEKVLSKNSIQVGAFRKYAGAKVYAKRYTLLTNKYSVDIKENVKDNEPLYRVQIEGFLNENEARNFMERYGLTGAFLVIR